MDVNPKNFPEILKKDKAIVDFWAPWCGPCINLAPIIEEVSKESGVDLVKCNIQDFPEMAEQYNIMSIPTVLVMEKGIIKETIVGTRPKQNYLNALK